MHAYLATSGHVAQSAGMLTCVHLLARRCPLEATGWLWGTLWHPQTSMSADVYIPQHVWFGPSLTSVDPEESQEEPA